MENSKIVIIANFSSNGRVGIQKILKNKSADFVREYLFHLDTSGKFPLYQPKISKETNRYLYLSEDKVSNEPFDNWQVLMITDTLDPNNEYREGIFDKNTFVMFHSTPSNIEEFLEDKGIKSKRKGQHEIGQYEKESEDFGYPLINYLIDAYDSEKSNFNETKYADAIRKLIDWFPIDEVKVRLNPSDSNLTSAAKLSILHSCLTSVGAASIDKSLLNDNQKVIIEL